MRSLIDNNAWADQINIYFCPYQVPEKNLDKIRQIVESTPNHPNLKQRRKLILIDPAKHIADIKRLGLPPYKNSYGVWLRLFAIHDIPITPPSRRKNTNLSANQLANQVIYIDSDTLVLSTLEPLANQPIPSLALTLAPSNKFFLWIHYIDKNIYGLNTGAVVFNMLEWQKIPVQNLMIELVKENKSNLVFTDQDILNSVDRKYIQELSPKFLFFPHMINLNPALLLRLIGLRDRKFIEQYRALVNHDETVVIVDSGPVYGYHTYFQLEGNLNPYAPQWHSFFRATPFYGTWTPPLGKRAHAWVRYIPRTLRTILAALYSYHRYRIAKKIAQEFALKFRKVVVKVDPEHKYFIG
jgi:hypothetical protein